MDTIHEVSSTDAAKYLMDIPACCVKTEGVAFDEVYDTVSVSSGDEDLDTIFAEVAEEYGVNVTLLKAVAQAESGFDANAVSSCGAMGIMQLMPQTAKSLEVEDPYDAKQSITGGAKMLGYLLDDYNGNITLALAAYNAGSGAVNKYGGVPPYKETQRYISKINDILGGALDNDSTTIEGAEPTVLSSLETVQQYSSPLRTSTESIAYKSAPVIPTAAYNSDNYTALMNTYLKESDMLVKVLKGKDYSEIVSVL